MLDIFLNFLFQAVLNCMNDLRESQLKIANCGAPYVFS
jgi:hypothetical protein